MSVQLTNRQSVKAQLAQFIKDMAVPEDMIATILEAPVTEKEFLNQLDDLNHKLNIIKELNFKESKSAQDVSDVLEKLKIKAMTKVRVYLLEQIYKFRKPMANYQVPQNAMLKYKFLFKFILSNERQVAQEICTEYMDTMSKIYYSYFRVRKICLIIVSCPFQSINLFYFLSFSRATRRVLFCSNMKKLSVKMI